MIFFCWISEKCVNPFVRRNISSPAEWLILVENEISNTQTRLNFENISNIKCHYLQFISSGSSHFTSQSFSIFFIELIPKPKALRKRLHTRHQSIVANVHKIDCILCNRFKCGCIIWSWIAEKSRKNLRYSATLDQYILFTRISQNLSTVLPSLQLIFAQSNLRLNLRKYALRQHQTLNYYKVKLYILTRAALNPNTGNTNWM